MIGVFGDSYADCGLPELITAHRMPWPVWLEKLCNQQVISYGQSGSSAWYSYKKFLTQYKRCETVVFCYSDFVRWPNVNDAQGKSSTGLNNVVCEDQLPFVDPQRLESAQLLVQAYPLLEDLKLQLFLFQTIFNSVNSLCDAAGVQCVNVLSFEQCWNTPLNIDISTTKNPVITGLAELSTREYMDENNNVLYADIDELMSTQPDKRFCHLNTHNNLALAQLIQSVIGEQNTVINCVHSDKFSYAYEHLEYLLEL